MRALLWMVLAGSCGYVAGCSEVVRPIDRSVGTAIDVVGEPADPMVDLTKPADILGSAATITDGGEPVADSVPALPTPADEHQETTTPIETSNEPDVAGSLGLEKADPLKTSKRDLNQPE